MKALAIFYDSLREALDSKVLYVTVGLSLLVILLTASVSFRQIPVQEQVENLAEFATIMAGMQQTSEEFRVANFQQVNDAADPWQGDYRFDWVVKLPRDNPLTKGAVSTDMKQQHHDQVTSTATTRMIVESAGPRFDRVEVGEREEIPAEDASVAKAYRFRITTQGTKIKDRRGWAYEPALFFGAWPISFLRTIPVPLGRSVEFIADDLIGTFGSAVTMLLSIVITAFFIPNMLRKGTIDLLLAKPIHRSTLLIYKFIGGLSFMFLNTLIVMVGLWIVLGLRTGLWVNGLLVCVLLFTFQFAIFYAVSTCAAVLTRSTIVAILASVATWVILLGIGWGYRIVDATRPQSAVAAEALSGESLAEEARRKSSQSSSILVTVVDVIHFVTPHYKDLDLLTTQLIRGDLLDPGSRQLEQARKSVTSINWTESIGMTVLFIAAMLGLSCWWFATRDY